LLSSRRFQHRAVSAHGGIDSRGVRGLDGAMVSFCEVSVLFFDWRESKSETESGRWMQKNVVSEVEIIYSGNCGGGWIF
ncbi:hypothetical protein KCU83_g75, partial [Aureobasidium melanogenum]